MNSKLKFLFIIILIIVICCTIFIINFYKTNDSKEQISDNVVSSTVEIVDNNIFNESLIDEFIDNSENNIDSTLDIELNSNSDDQSNELIEIEFIGGRGNTQEKDGIVALYNPQTDEDYKNFYGYYIYKINNNEIGEYDAYNYNIKRRTENNIVELVFYTSNSDEIEIICEYNLDSSNYNQNFLLNFEEESIESSEQLMNQIAKEGDFDNNDFEVYSYSGNIKVTINEKTYELKEALENDILTVNDILEQINMDVLYGICEKTSYDDGGSIEYYYDNYTILKYNTLDGNKDLIIGQKESIINTINETQYKGINHIGESQSEIDGVSLTIKSGTLTNSSATVIISDENSQKHSYEQWFRIDKKENDEWKQLDTISDDYAFIALAYNIGEDGTLEMNQDWEELYGKLESGTYRLVKSIYDNGTKYFLVEFTIN